MEGHMNNRFLRDFPSLLSEWDYEKNSHLALEKLTLHSTKNAWWKCPLGHSYLQPVYVHARGSACPYCSHQKILKGFNDLASQAPGLASQADAEKNGTLSPDMVMVHSNKKIWWKCSLGHSWEASPNSRSKGLGCPYCSNHRVLTGFNDLASRYPEIAMEWDPDRNPALPEAVLAGSHLKAWWRCPEGHSYEMTVCNRTGNGLRCPVCSGHRIIAGVNDLGTVMPELLSEWDFEKNAGLAPSMVTRFTSRKVWWKCSLGHSWRTAVYNRSNGTGCPYCSNRKVLQGFNDLMARYPFVNEYWDFPKNAPVDPSTILPSYSRRKIWWKCSLGHTWSSLLASFLKNPTCPFCEKRKTIERSICLAEGYPDIASEWHPEKNGDLTADKVPAGSNLVVWWKCPKGHSYKKRISRRVFESSCPYCSGWSLAPGLNDLETLFPEVAAEWDYIKNDPLTPRQVSRAEPRKVWWLCPKGHSYASTIASRTLTKQGCPYCRNRKIIAGFNDLATLFPGIAGQWDYEKNHPLRPTEVAARAGKRVWWKCDKGHSWDAVIVNRTSRRTGCPYCGGQLAITGETDFATVNPSLLKEWDYEKNGNVSPSSLASRSTFVAWWKCDKGHSWSSPVYSRTYGESCPFCQSTKPYYSRLI